jgi:hypothetical protein
MERFWLGIHKDAHASVVVRHLQGQPEYEPEELKSQSLSLSRLVDARRAGRSTGNG